ncbi:MAG: YfaZ family protein [Gammaproteobacteria bacterium]|nr:YfaZ family protein [Gammaproteobacteria bacterium]
MIRAIAGLLLLVGSGASLAGGLDLSLSNETANLAIQLNPGSRYVPQAGSGTDFTIGAFINETGDNLVFGTMMARGVRQSATTQYKLGAGIKLVAGDLDISESVGALALGFQSSILMASSFYNPVDFVIEAFYAPSISSFQDAESYTELAARIQVEVIPRARAFVGYRRIHFDTNDFSDLTLDRSVHVGLSISF